MESIAAQIASVWPFNERRLTRVVVKVGSNVLAAKSGGLNDERVEALCAELAAMRKADVEVILVSSGAVAAGRGILGLGKRPGTIPELQAVAAIGQGALMEEYNRYLRPHGLVAAQLLLNRDDMDHRRRYLNARHALTSLLQYDRVIPVINENDSVNIDELKFGDNDMLSAIVAAKMDADLLIILSNVAGLMTGHPKHDPDARIIPVIERVTADVDKLVHSEKSDLGTGGMSTKLLAARHATQFGVACVIVDGMTPGKLGEVMQGRFVGTFFCAKQTRRTGAARRHWIGTHRPRGSVVVDHGAEKALVHSRKSLLPVGIRSVTGRFKKGDVVRIEGLEGIAIAQGITNYDSATLEKLIGKHGPEIHEAFADATYEEAIHSNNIVLL